MAELKTRRLPTFGTAAERKDRLKKFHGKLLLLGQSETRSKILLFAILINLSVDRNLAAELKQWLLKQQ